MGRPGSALDNAVIESWHSTVEFELRRVEHFATRAAAPAGVAAWIEDYNHHRRHSACGLISPVACERSPGGTPRDREAAARPRTGGRRRPPSLGCRVPGGGTRRLGYGAAPQPQGCCAPPAGGGLQGQA